MNKEDVLRDVDFGKRVAEDEVEHLATYFVETDHWRRIYSGDVDIVYGPKGSGKSAIYVLLTQRMDALFDRRIMLLAAENPRGATAFGDLASDPPTSESEFVGLWKLYFATLISNHFNDWGLHCPESRRLRKILEQESLVEKGHDLRGILRSVYDYVRKALRRPQLEGGVQLDPATGLPIGFKGKITFEQPSLEAEKSGFVSADGLLRLAEEALIKSEYSIWVLIDRLDVAFADSEELEHNALRALFRVYLDCRALYKVGFKIFLRTDIWRRISETGFREASHITRHLTIHWDSPSLMNLIVSRSLRSENLARFYGVETDAILSSRVSQLGMFYRLVPDQVDVGPNKPQTFDWVISRVRDGTKLTAPRELIHFFNCLREGQVRRLELGEEEPEGEMLFSRPAFKDALPEVSRVRLEQTLYAEFPWCKDWLERVRQEKTLQFPKSLARIWAVPEAKAGEVASALVAIGFFERRGTKTEPEYWVPFLYRDALEMVQGTAEQ